MPLSGCNPKPEGPGFLASNLKTNPPPTVGRCKDDLKSCEPAFCRTIGGSNKIEFLSKFWLGFVEFSMSCFWHQVASCHSSHWNQGSIWCIYLSDRSRVVELCHTADSLFFFSVVSQKCQTKRSNYFLLCTHPKFHIAPENPFLLGRQNFRGHTIKLCWGKMNCFCWRVSLCFNWSETDKRLSFFFWSLYGCFRK